MVPDAKGKINFNYWNVDFRNHIDLFLIFRFISEIHQGQLHYEIFLKSLTLLHRLVPRHLRIDDQRFCKRLSTRLIKVREENFHRHSRA